MAKPRSAASGKKKVKKNVPYGILHVNSNFNNTLVTATDSKGNVIAWSSSGTEGFKGVRKGTPFAAQSAAESVARRAKEQGMRSMIVLVKGPGGGRETAIRAMQSAGIEVTLIKDMTPIPHNGCRPKKRRRV
ncbi:MAG: 30S ribosomal protein S11 [Vampirovibrionales bacterium]|nr:30S ribosomal protein S11 [Vampirovibrionales bacterium]